MIEDWLYGLLGGLLIGAASVLLLLCNGRIAGISGLLANVLSVRDVRESLAFLAGLIAAPALYAAALGAPELTVTRSAWLLLAGGLLVGFGTRTCGGCTSGHGVCGLSRLSLRSLVATGTFMGVAGVVVFVTRHLMGGA
jgi:uncharacterized membrane protein YedE/YeeE